MWSIGGTCVLLGYRSAFLQKWALNPGKCLVSKRKVLK